jgi:hypothetical protein
MTAFVSTMNSGRVNESGKEEFEECITIPSRGGARVEDNKLSQKLPEHST